MKRSLHTPEPIELHVEVGSGSVHITAADTELTEIEVTGPRADDVVIEQDGDHVRVAEPAQLHRLISLSRALQVSVRIPANSTLSTRLGSADLQIEGTLGACTVASGSGTVQADRTGPLDATTGSGRLAARTVDGDLRARTGSGNVTVTEVTGSADLSSGSGDLHVQTVGGGVTTRTGSGRVTVGTVGGDVTTTTASGDVEVGQIRSGRLRCRSASGDVCVTVAAGIPTWTDLHSVSGRIEQSLQPLGEPRDGQDHVELRARTVSGAIRVRHGAPAASPG